MTPSAPVPQTAPIPTADETRRALPYNNTYCFVFRLSGGKIREITEYCDTDLIARVLDNRAAAVASAG